MQDEIRLKVAIQKSGRLTEKSMNLLKESGIQIQGSKRRLTAIATNFPMDIVFLRDDDIPGYIEDGIADVGIIGENVYKEANRKVIMTKKLGFASCRLSLAIPRGLTYTGLDYWNNKRIATSYPMILQSYLSSKGIEAQIHSISGSVEVAPSLNLADGIFDIVSTGDTLLSNGLVEVEQVMKSEAILIEGIHLPTTKRQILDKLLFRFEASMAAKNNKYILLNAPDDKLEEISSLIPGMKSPSVFPLRDEGWSSIHSVVNERDFWDVIDDLRELGAQGILVLPIEKMII